MKKNPQGTEVQSLLFTLKAKPATQNWTVAKARAWLKKHGYKTPKVDSTDDYLRFRQKPTFSFNAGTFRTITFGKGIKAVIARPRADTKKPAAKRKRAKNATVVVHGDDMAIYKAEGSNKAAMLWVTPGQFEVNFGNMRGDQFMPSHHKNSGFYASRSGAEFGIRKWIGESKLRRLDLKSILMGNPKKRAVKGPKRVKPRAVGKRGAAKSKKTGVKVTSPAKNPRSPLPTVLVYLGRAVELVGDDFKLKWLKRDNMDLYTNAAGNALFVVKTKKVPVGSSKFNAAVERKRATVDKGLDLYARFQGFQSITGSIMAAPKTAFKKLGRAV